MFCPICRFEYLPHVTECPDCGEPLVAELPEEDEDEPEFLDDGELAAVFSSSDPSALMLAKSLLEEADIDCFVDGQIIAETFGFHPMIGNMTLQVRSEDGIEAHNILSELMDGDEDIVPDADETSS